MIKRKEIFSGDRVLVFRIVLEIHLEYFYSLIHNISLKRVKLFKVSILKVGMKFKFLMFQKNIFFLVELVSIHTSFEGFMNSVDFLICNGKPFCVLITRKIFSHPYKPFEVKLLHLVKFWFRGDHSFCIPVTATFWRGWAELLSFEWVLRYLFSKISSSSFRSRNFAQNFRRHKNERSNYVINYSLPILLFSLLMQIFRIK